MPEQIDLNIDEYIVRSYHADFKQRLSVVSLFNFLQESAWRHASRNSFGFYDLLSQGFFWALTRVKVIIDQYPQWTDNLRIETWSKEPDALIAYRDFEIFNSSNERLISASTAWLIVDINSRRPQRMSQFKDKFPHLPNRYAIAEHPEKLPSLPEPIENQSEQRPICTTDMDMNGHVNNTNYVRWILDTYPLSFLEKHNLSEIEVNFMHESKAGQHYKVYTTKENDENHLCSIIRSEDNCELTRARLKFTAYTQ